MPERMTDEHFKLVDDFRIVQREMDAMIRHMTSMPTCVSCKYWEPVQALIDKVVKGGPADDISLEGGIGKCHRFPPPRPDHQIEEDFPRPFPATFSFDWCGEWVRRPNSVIYGPEYAIPD